MSNFLRSLLKATGTSDEVVVSDKLLYNKVIGFQGLSRDVGVSSLVYAFAEYISLKTPLRVCVVDTEIMFPVLRDLLLRGKARTVSKDIMDYSGSAADVVEETNLERVYICSMYNRGARHVVSVMDSADTAKSLMDGLKEGFDIILVDLGLFNLTTTSATMAHMCNKLYFVGSNDSKSLTLYQRGLGVLRELGVVYEYCPLIINKSLGAVKGFSEFILLGEIPFSQEAVLYLNKGILMRARSKDAGVLAYERVCQLLYDDIFAKSVGENKSSVALVRTDYNIEDIASVESLAGTQADDDLIEVDLD